MKFLDPNKPIATCISKTCDNCTVSNALHCQFTLRDFIHFLLISLPCFLLGGAGIYHISGWMLIPWLIFIIGYFGFIEIRVMCSHCPHYAEEGSSLKCRGNMTYTKDHITTALWTGLQNSQAVILKITHSIF